MGEALAKACVANRAGDKLAYADAEAEMTTAYPTNGAKNSWRYLLLGDPEMTVRRDYTPIRIDYPPTGWIPKGPFDIELIFEDEKGEPIEEGLVSAWKEGSSGEGGLDAGDEVFVNDYTDAGGLAQLSFDTQSEGILHIVARDLVGNQDTLELPIGCGALPYGENLGGPNVLLLEHEDGYQPGDVIETSISGDFAPGAPVLIGYSTSKASLPLFGGTALIDPGSLIKFQLRVPDANGEAQDVIAIPALGVIGSMSMYIQAFSPDAKQPGGWAMSNGLEISFCPIDG